MPDALTEAFNSADRMHASARKAAAIPAGEIIGAGPRGLPAKPSDLAQAAEQYKHFKGWPYAAIRAIAQRIAGQGIRVGRITGQPNQGTKESRWYTHHSLPGRLKGMSAQIEPMVHHPLVELLANPNDLGTGWTLLYATVASIQLTGRAFWWLVERAGRRQIFMLPTSWIVGFEGGSKIVAWLVRPPGHAGEPLTIPAEEMVYFFLPDPSDPHGAVSPLQAQGAAVETDEHIQTAQWQMFRNGIHPRHVITAGRLPGMNAQPGMRPVLTADQRKQLLNSILSVYGGLRNRDEPLILDGLIEKIERLSATVEEMDFLNSGKITKERILLGQGVNPIILGEIEGANRASAVVAEQHFCEFTVNPLIEMLSAAMTEWLGPAFAREGERLVVWIEPCVANDSELELKRIDLLARHALATTDELRALAGLPPAPSTMFGDAPPRRSPNDGTIDAIVYAAQQVANQTWEQVGQEQYGEERRAYQRNGRATT